MAYDSKTDLIVKTGKCASMTFEQAQDSLEFFRDNFPWSYVSTMVEKITHSWSYVARQRYIDWRNLSDVCIDELHPRTLYELFYFVETAISILLKDGKYFDIVGNQWKTYDEVKSELGIFEKLIERICPIAHYNLVKNIFSSTNFVISKDGKAHFVDNIVSHGIYENTFFWKVLKLKKIIYRYFVLLWYKRQILHIIEKKKN